MRARREADFPGIVVVRNKLTSMKSTGKANGTSRTRQTQFDAADPLSALTGWVARDFEVAIVTLD